MPDGVNLTCFIDCCHWHDRGRARAGVMSGGGQQDGGVSTAPPAVAVGVSREPARRPRPRLDEPSSPEPGEGVDYTIGDGVARAVEGHAYDRLPGDPLHRPLQIYALDPSLSRLEGSTATVNVPFEPLEPGFKGRLFEVDAHDGGTHQDYRHLDLDDRVVLLGNGLRPFPADPCWSPPFSTRS